VLKKSDNYQALKYSRMGRVRYNRLLRGFSRGKGKRGVRPAATWALLVVGLFRRSKERGMDIIPAAACSQGVAEAFGYDRPRSKRSDRPDPEHIAATDERDQRLPR
jgi:hypothetical protein